jgi:hypothetical protein
MKEKTTKLVTIRLSQAEFAALNHLIALSGRPRAQVLRRLILEAKDRPQALQALGCLSNQS